MIMKNYAGLDVSLKEISICVIDQDGEMVAHGTTLAAPEEVAGWLKNKSLKPETIVHESGRLSTWLQRGRVGLHQFMSAAKSPIGCALLAARANV